MQTLIDLLPRLDRAHHRALRYRVGDLVLLEGPPPEADAPTPRMLSVVVEVGRKVVAVRDPLDDSAQLLGFSRRQGTTQRSDADGEGAAIWRLLGRAVVPEPPLEPAQRFTLQGHLLHLAMVVEALPLERYLRALDADADGEGLTPDEQSLRALAAALLPFQRQAQELADADAPTDPPTNPEPDRSPDAR